MLKHVKNMWIHVKTCYNMWIYIKLIYNIILSKVMGNGYELANGIHSKDYLMKLSNGTRLSKLMKHALLVWIPQSIASPQLVPHKNKWLLERLGSSPSPCTNILLALIKVNRSHRKFSQQQTDRLKRYLKNLFINIFQSQCWFQYFQ